MWYVRQRSAGSRKIVSAMYGLAKVKFQYWFWCWGGKGTPAPTPISNAMYIAGRQKSALLDLRDTAYCCQYLFSKQL